ncbi:unnamed protein product [Pylaiella littoralis]
MAAIVSAAPSSEMDGNMLIPPDGLVKLKDKTIPVIEQVVKEQLDPEARPLVFTRGRADVSLLKQLLSSRGASVWTDEEHARSNVKMRRQAHDRWGISKIVFVYCDDFLKKVYTFPWFHEPAWRQALQPVLDVLGIREDKMVRCLLASMPPACVIPVHHDTGHWVQHSHRVHVAIVTDVAEVDFFVGPDPEHMSKVAFDEGRVVELNNQAKHAVTNGWSRDRVHLILDYVDDYPLEFVRLSPGAKLVQTRRSIDVEGLAKREGPDPAFIVLGGQKCGTTLLYECLNQHPLVNRGRRRETHFFDWAWPAAAVAAAAAAGQEKSQTLDQLRQAYMRFFHREELETHPSIVTGESTPSYLLRGDLVIPRLKKVAGQSRLLVMLRDPVTRAYSHYQMAVDPEGTPAQLRSRGGGGWTSKTFEQVVEEEKAVLERAGICPESTPADFAREYLSTRPNGYGGHSLLGRGLYALQLKPWLEAFGPDQVKVLFLEEVVQSEASLQEAMDGVFEHVGLPPSPVEDKAPKNHRDYPPMDEDVRRRMRDFYAPYDGALQRLLGRDSLPWSSPSS